MFFRTPEQPPVPGPRWSIAAEFNEARKSFLDVIELDVGSTAELYAARNLYLDAVAGDLPYSADEVLGVSGERPGAVLAAHPPAGTRVKNGPNDTICGDACLRLRSFAVGRMHRHEGVQ